MNRILVLAVLIVCGPALAAEQLPQCEWNPSESLKRTVVAIERTFDPDEVYFDRQAWSWISGIRGTAWFKDPRTLVTIGHVATGSKLTGDWKEVTLFWSDEKDQKENNSFKTRVRIKDILVGHAALEPIITLELESRVPGAKVAKIKEGGLLRNEAVVGLGYKDGELRFVEGRLALPEASGEPSDSPPPAPYLPFELVDINKERRGGRVEDRYAFDHGSSGSPIFDCNGEVAAVVQGNLWSRMSGAGYSFPITTPWGHANITGVSALPLLEKRK